MEKQEKETSPPTNKGSEKNASKYELEKAKFSGKLRQILKKKTREKRKGRANYIPPKRGTGATRLKNDCLAGEEGRARRNFRKKGEN